MNIQPIDLPGFLRAVTWPVLAAIVCILFRRPLNEFARTLGNRIQKVSIGSLSLELSQATAAASLQAVESDIRQLDAGLTPQSGTAELTTVLTQLRYGAPQDYILIDLGSESSRRWLTSRLYILCLLLTLIDRPQCLVFVEDLVSVRHRFVGVADSGQVRWALARSYRWLEAAGTGAYAVSIGGLQGPLQQGLLLLNTDAIPPIDPITGSLSDYQVSQLLQQFLALIRLASGVVPPDPDKWVLLGNQSYEHAGWLDGPRIERVLVRRKSGNVVHYAASQQLAHCCRTSGNTTASEALCLGC